MDRLWFTASYDLSLSGRFSPPSPVETSSPPSLNAPPRRDGTVSSPFVSTVQISRKSSLCLGLFFLYSPYLKRVVSSKSGDLYFSPHVTQRIVPRLKVNLWYSSQLPPLPFFPLKNRPPIRVRPAEKESLRPFPSSNIVAIVAGSSLTRSPYRPHAVSP